MKFKDGELVHLNINCKVITSYEREGAEPRYTVEVGGYVISGVPEKYLIEEEGK